MTGRELVFSNPDVIRLIKDSFVPYAGDQWYLHRQQDADGEFFWKVAGQSHHKDQPRNQTRQGVYAALADGQFLGSDHFHPDPARMVRLLQRSLAKGQQLAPAAAKVELAAAVDTRFQRVPPPGGVVLDAYTRIPQPASATEWTPNHATGRDHVWITKEEARALLPARWEKGAAVPLSKAVTERLLRFHLVDNVRGEPPMWGRDEIRQADLQLVVEDPAAGRLRLAGTAVLRTADSSRGYEARLQGYVEYDRAADQFRRFDLLSWGRAWGEGPYTRRAPEGKFPLLVALSLAGDAPADRVPPQASRDRGDYFGTGR
ncbi:MAG: hypothetical protein ACK47B_25010 [Armatimonadota bacterium]